MFKMVLSHWLAYFSQMCLTLILLPDMGNLTPPTRIIFWRICVRVRWKSWQLWKVRSQLRWEFWSGTAREQHLSFLIKHTCPVDLSGLKGEGVEGGAPGRWPYFKETGWGTGGEEGSVLLLPFRVSDVNSMIKCVAPKGSSRFSGRETGCFCSRQAVKCRTACYN